MGNVFLDYNQKTAKRLYDNTVKSLYAEHKDKFEIIQPQIPTFLTKLLADLLWLEAPSSSPSVDSEIFVSAMQSIPWPSSESRQLPTLGLQQDWHRTTIPLLQCSGTPYLTLLLLWWL